jgi:hypothetical protein
MDDIHGNRGPGPAQYSKTLAHQGEARLLELGEKYKADYLVCSTLIALRLPRLFKQGSYAVYSLTNDEVDSPGGSGIESPELP